MLRSLVASFAVVAYAVLAVTRAAGAPPAWYGSLLPALLVLYLVHRWTRPAEPAALDRARFAARVAFAGMLVAITGLVGSTTAEGRLAVALGAGVAAVAGLVALRRVRAEEGMVSRQEAKLPALGGDVLVGLVWLVAAGVAAMAMASPARVRSLPQDGLALTASVASLASIGVYLATGALEARRRRLELGAADRLRAFVTIAAAFMAIAVVAGALRLVHLPTLFVVCCMATTTCAIAASVTRTPEGLGRIATHVAALGLLAVVPSVVLAAVARQSPELGALAVLGAGAAAALGGFAAPALAKVLLPTTEPWTRAFEAASRAATHPDPEPALERALRELRGLSSLKLEAPCLFRFDPATVTTVDVAGYARTEEVALPDSVAELARTEPENVVTKDALDAVAVRRPEVRPTMTWLEDRALSAVAVLSDEDLPIGMLGLPRGHRRSPLTLAEVRALGHLARLLAAQLSASSKLARSREREREARERSDATEKQRDVLVAELAAERHRGDAVCRTLAARARVGSYSPAARMTLDSLERFGRDGEPLTIIVPPGVEPLPYLAVFHLAAERKSSALFVVDGRKTELADLELWRDAEKSPFAQARGGTLVILDPQLLPRLVQVYVSSAHLASRDAPRIDRAALAVVVPRTLDALVARGAMDDRLADALGDRALALPPLSARSEDLRSLVLERLTRLGLDLHGKPLGIEPAALALLAEHDWPANDVELDSVLVRVATSLGDGELVRRQDLVKIGWTSVKSGEGRRARAS